MIKLAPRVTLNEAGRRLGHPGIPAKRLATILPHLVFCPNAPNSLWVIRAVFVEWLDGLLASRNLPISPERVGEYTATPKSQAQLRELHTKWGAQITGLADSQGLTPGVIATIFGAGAGAGYTYGRQRIDTWARDPDHPLTLRPNGRISGSDFLKLFIVQLPGDVQLTFDPPDG